MPRFLTALSAAFALALTSCASAPQAQTAAPVIEQAATQNPWPFDESDLPPDPSYRFGVLDNGMRYIIRPNATPPQQGMVQLWVDVGSTAEEEHQQGWAHYVEHMAFNGSTNVPEGEMVKLLEREGLAFGADTNASTGFDTTLYKLDLPRNDLALLETALMLMRETASELTFDEEAVERERGIILSERSVRDTYQLRAFMDAMAFQYPGSRLSQRLPAGTTEAINGATGAGLREFWQTYYRPQNVALVVIGDFDAETVEAAIAERFADWQAPPRIAPPAHGPVDTALAGRTDIYLNPALPEEISVSRNGPWLGGPDTSADRRERLLRQIGYDIVNRRLQRLARLEEPPFRGAALATSDVFTEGRTTDLTIYAANGQWRSGLAAAQEEYRRALAYGFTASEVAEQLANYRASIEANAAGAATRSNDSFITGAVTLLRDRQVPTTPQSALERFNAHAPMITPETVHAAFLEELLPLSNPLIRFEGSTAPEGSEAALRAAWEEGMATQLAAPEQTELAEFAYQDFGPAGEVVADGVFEPLGIRTIAFANGLRLNLKKTDLQEDRVLLELNVDGGDMLATRDNPLATALVGSLPMGGLGAHTFDELQSILAGRLVSFSIGSGDSSFVMQASTTPADLELQLQLLAAALSDAAYRPSQEAQVKRNIEAYFARRYATPSGALSADLGTIISDGDPRFSLQSQESYDQLSFAKLREDISDRLANGAMEMAMVGDIDEDAAIALVARTLGALPAREAEFLTYEDNRDRAFTQDRSMRTIYHDGEPDQALILLAWPTRDDSDHLDNLTLEMLERVAQIVLTESLREELGQTYSPSVDADQSRIYPGYGTFDMSASVDLAQVESSREAMIAVVNSLREEAVSDDILLRARTPLLEAYDNALDTNGGWMSVADETQSQPHRIERFLSARDKLAALTPEQLRAMAQRYLDPAAALEVRVLPRPAAGQ